MYIYVCVCVSRCMDMCIFICNIKVWCNLHLQVSMRLQEHKDVYKLFYIKMYI